MEPTLPVTDAYPAKININHSIDQISFVFVFHHLDAVADKAHM